VRVVSSRPWAPLNPLFWIWRFQNIAWIFLILKGSQFDSTVVGVIPSAPIFNNAAPSVLLKSSQRQYRVNIWFDKCKFQSHLIHTTTCNLWGDKEIKSSWYFKSCMHCVHDTIPLNLLQNAAWIIRIHSDQESKQLYVVFFWSSLSCWKEKVNNLLFFKKIMYG